jgi:hypothetical protein
MHAILRAATDPFYFQLAVSLALVAAKCQSNSIQFDRTYIENIAMQHSFVAICLASLIMHYLHTVRILSLISVDSVHIACEGWGIKQCMWFRSIGARLDTSRDR